MRLMQHGLEGFYAHFETDKGENNGSRADRSVAVTRTSNQARSLEFVDNCNGEPTSQQVSPTAERSSRLVLTNLRAFPPRISAIKTFQFESACPIGQALRVFAEMSISRSLKRRYADGESPFRRGAISIASGNVRFVSKPDQSNGIVRDDGTTRAGAPFGKSTYIASRTTEYAESI